MKLKDNTTVKALREMLGKKIRTRTSRMLIEITSVELTNDTTTFIGHEVGNKTKRRVPLEHIKELIEFDDNLKESKPKRGLIERGIEAREAKERGMVWNGMRWEKPKSSEPYYPPTPPEGLGL